MTHSRNERNQQPTEFDQRNPSTKKEFSAKILVKEKSHKVASFFVSFYLAGHDFLNICHFATQLLLQNFSSLNFPLIKLENEDLMILELFQKQRFTLQNSSNLWNEVKHFAIFLNFITDDSSMIFPIHPFVKIALPCLLPSPNNLTTQPQHGGLASPL